MILTCDNKGCLQQTEAKLETKSNEVLCGNCGKNISNITEIMKKTLKSLGQVIRVNDKKAFMVPCIKCGANREAIIDENENAFCKICKSALTLHPSMKQAIKQFKTSDETEDDYVDKQKEKVEKVKKA